MSHPFCNKAAGFAIEAANEYAGKTVDFSILLEDNIFLSEEILSCEWYMDGILIDNQYNRTLQGRLYLFST